MWRKNDYSKAHFHHVYKKNLFCNNEKGTRIACQTVFKRENYSILYRVLDLLSQYNTSYTIYKNLYLYLFT